MKQKALNSLKAAQRLVDAYEIYGYNLSKHCSYYALLQYMKYKLATYSSNPLEYTKQTKKGSSSHNFILQEIEVRINNPVNERAFSRVFYKLKKQRILADYKQKDFTEKESLKCKKVAEEAIEKLNHFL